MTHTAAGHDANHISFELDAQRTRYSPGSRRARQFRFTAAPGSLGPDRLPPDIAAGGQDAPIDPPRRIWRLPQLYEQFNPMRYEDARTMEVKLGGPVAVAGVCGVIAASGRVG